MGQGGSKQEPTLTEKNLPDQGGKVFIVTGSTSGVGRELAAILYSRNAKVYLAVRSKAKADATISLLKSKYPYSKGSLVFLHLDLNDLSTIKSSAQEFLQKEQRLDVLWNNAGVMVPPQGSQTKQGYELQLGTNCVGPFLFTKLVTPLLVSTAKAAPAGSVRVVWVSSSAARGFSPNGGVDMTNLDYHEDKGAWYKYGVSKAGNILHAKAYAQRYKVDGVVSVALDPGNLKTDLYKSMPRWQMPIVNLALKDPIYGAYTEIFAGLSPEISLSNTGTFIEPWGQTKPARADIEEAGKPKAQGGTGIGEEFWQWTEKQVEQFV